MAIFTLIGSALAAAGFTGAITFLGLSPALTATLIQAGKAVLWGALARAIAPKAVPQQVQATIAQEAGPRIRGYGEYLLGGTRVLREAASGVLHQIIVAHHGPITEVLHWEVDGEEVVLDGAGNVTTGSAAYFIVIKAILAGDGGDYAVARAAFPTIWTVDHKLTGQTTYYTTMAAPPLAKLAQVFPRQAETAITMVAKLSAVMDPRTGNTAYSDLTGPAVLDFLTHPDGYRMPLDAIDLPSFAAFTTVCDEAVPLRAGGTEKRYRVGGYYSLDDAPKDVLARLLMTADAQLYMTSEGKVGILGGRWVAPDVTIHADDILALSLTDGFDEFTDFNVLKGMFTSGAHRYQKTECAELVDDVALLTQPERVETLEIDLCPSAPQMRRLMHLWRARQLRRYTGSMRTNLVGLKARFPRGDGPHIIRVIDPEDGLDEVFEVTSHSYSVGSRTCEIGIATLANAYPWTPATQEGDPPPALEDLEKPTLVVPVPTGLTLSQEVVALASGQNAVRIVGVVADPARPALQLRLEYQLVIAPGWQPMVVGQGDLRGFTGVVADGQVYQVRAAWQGYDVWSTVASITAISNPVAPAVPTAFSHSYSAPTITLNWTNGVAGYYQTRVYRGTSATFSAATLLGAPVAGVAGQPSSKTDAPGTGTWYYWVVTINASLLESAPVGPVSQTI